MAKKVEPASKGRRSVQGKQAVASARRAGPGRGFWLSVAAIVVVGVGLLAWQATKPKVTSRTMDPNLPKLKAEGYVIGSPTAPVEVVEFADFECPGCGQFATLTEPDIRAKYVNTGLIRMRYMNFMIESHRNTWDASLAASCANEQGKFWEMHDALFRDQDKWNSEATSNPKKVMRGMAEALGLNLSQYDSCIDTEKFRAQVQANFQEGITRGVNQTPTFLIGDKMYPGGLPWDEFKKVVDVELAKHPATAAPADTSKKGK